MAYVMTPDHDIYPEQVSLENDDLAGFRIGGGAGLPYGLDDSNTYRIRNLPPAAEMQQIRIDARHAGLAMGAAPGAPAGGGAVVVAAAPAPAAVGVGAADSGKWLVVESEGGRQRGDEVSLDGSETIHGKIGLKVDNGTSYAIRWVPSSEVSKYAGREAAADARLLGVSFQGLNRVERVWRDLAKELSQESFDDWGVPGPRTSYWWQACQQRSARHALPVPQFLEGCRMFFV